MSFMTDERGKFKTFPLLLSFLFILGVLVVWQERWILLPYLPAEWAERIRPAPGPPALAEPAAAEEVATQERRVEAPPPLPAAKPQPVIVPVDLPSPEARAAVNMPAIQQQPKKWPKQVALRQNTPFPVSVGGTSGSLTAPVGTLVEVVRVEGEKIFVRHPTGGVAEVHAHATDFQERVYKENPPAATASAAGKLEAKPQAVPGPTAAGNRPAKP